MRFIFCLALTILTTASALPEAPPPSSTAGNAEVLGEVAAIRRSADRLLATGNPDDAAKAAALFDKAAALEQTSLTREKWQLERAKLLQDLEDSKHINWKDLVTNLAPLISTIVLAGTLFFQIYSARVAEKQKRDEDVADAARKENLRWVDVVKLVHSSEKTSTAGMLLSTFPKEPYRTKALNLTVTLLLQRQTSGEFQSLFTEMMTPPTYEMLQPLRDLCVAVKDRYFKIATLENWNEALARTDVTKLSPEDRIKFDLYTDEQIFLSTKIAELLRTSPPPSLKVDLSNLILRDVDLRGVNFGKANITAVNWNYIDLWGADLSQVTEFAGCMVTTTAWWQAARISPPLLAFLKKNFPYRPGGAYNTTQSSRPISQQEYAESVANLERISRDAGGSSAGAL